MKTKTEHLIDNEMIGNILEKYEHFKENNPHLKSYEYIDDFVRELTQKPIGETGYYCPTCDCYLTEIQVAEEHKTFFTNPLTIQTHVLCGTKID